MNTEDDIPFPTPEEAEKILAEEGIDTTQLQAWALGKVREIKAKREAKTRLAVQQAFCHHDWVMTWPLDPCEYECSKCGEMTRN